MVGSARVEVRNDILELVRLHEQLEAFSAGHNVPRETVYRLGVSLEEVFTNVVNHAYADADPHTIRVSFAFVNDSLAIEVEDDGMPFDPLQVPPPDNELPLDQRRPGGQGIHLVRRLMDEVAYRREGGHNVLQMKKYVMKISGEST
jgi:anti-sigma regulatory factor (Ser/Thr protein kinase)